MDISERNLVTAENAETPAQNPLDGWNAYYMRPDTVGHTVRVYYTDREEVLIVGEADENYICWFSVTRRDDLETNRKIFDYLYRMKPALFGSLSFLLRETDYTWEQLQQFYSAELTTADEILQHYRRVKAMCRFREANGKYLQVMRHNLRLLQVRTADPATDYETIRSIQKLVESERYLLCSDNETVRELYLRLVQNCDEIYQAYMTEARGGA